MDLVVPVASLTGAEGNMDERDTSRYALAFADWSADASALLCGSTGQGDALEPRVRSQIFDLWAEVLPAARLLCCAWDQTEAAMLIERGRRVLLVVAGSASASGLAALIHDLDGEVYLYSHPRFGWSATAELVGELRIRGAQPSGVKLSKCTLDELAACRRVGSAGLTLWDGSARHARASVSAGADGVVAGCLAALPGRGPSGPEEMQRLADPQLRLLDALPDRTARLHWTVGQVRRTLRVREVQCSG